MGVNGIYGLSGSGLDIESMVKVGMMGKQNEYDKMAQKYTKNEWTKSAYLELSNSINTFKVNKISDYTMSSSTNAKAAESSDPAVKVTANASASLVNHNVVVNSMSSNARAVSTVNPTRISGGDDDKMKLSSILFNSINYNSSTKIASGTTADGKSFSVNTNTNANAIEFVLKDGTKNADGTEKSATISMTYKEIADGATFNDLVTKINKSGLNIRASYDSVYDNFSIYNTETGADNNISIAITAQDVSTIQKTQLITQDQTFTRSETRSGSGNFWSPYEYSYTDYTASGSPTNVVTNDPVQVSETYSNVVGSTTANFFNSWKLNQSKDGSLYKPVDSGDNFVGANIDENYWKFDWGTKKTTQTTITTQTNATYITNNHEDHGGGTTTTNGTRTSTSYTSGTAETTNNNVNQLNGTNASMTIDGVTYNKINDNKITVDGVTYTATKVGSSTVSISQDVDGIVDKVKSFVEDYNKLLSSLYEKYDEKPNSDFKPLTQSQKDKMKEEQIEKWEEKAKAGLLYHDSTLGKIINEMRSAVTKSVDGIDSKYNSIYSIGISTTGIKGQLKLDEDKLRAALAEDSDAVYNVISKLDENDESSKNGVAQKLGDILNTASKNIKTRAGSSSDINEDSDLNNLMRRLQTKMSSFKRMMNAYETALYKKYDKMETMLARLGTQMNFVTSSFQ